MPFDINLAHPKGEQKNTQVDQQTSFDIDTFAGKVQVEWDPNLNITPLGGLGFFIEYLKVANLFDPFVDSCPLHYLSNNGSSKINVLGSLLLSILSGHTRYSHITALRNDKVNTAMPGMTKVVSEDAARRALMKIDELDGNEWLQKHLKQSYAPLLQENYIIDVDTSVKELYGHQEGAVKGYNPKKPGRPSHSLHTYMIANLRLAMDVTTQPGNESAAKHGMPGLCDLLDDLPEHSKPAFVRGDCAYGNEPIISELEARNINYLFKLKMSPKVKKTVAASMYETNWSDAGKDWEGKKTSIRLHGWEKDRTIVILRRKTARKIDPSNDQSMVQMELFGQNIEEDTNAYEHHVLVTSLPDEILTLAQHYRDRADCENLFDELKNQWSWGGFATQDMHRCRLTARMTALIYNWWTIFMRLITPEKHTEAITSRPLLLSSAAKMTKHAGQTKLSVSCIHAAEEKLRLQINKISCFFKGLLQAEQLTPLKRYCVILSRAFIKFLGGRQLEPPELLPCW